MKIFAHEWQALLDALPAFLARIEQDPRRPASFLHIRFDLLTARPSKGVRPCDIVADRHGGRHVVPSSHAEAAGPLVQVTLHDGLLNILRRVAGFSYGVNEKYIFPSRQGHDKPFSNPSLSMSLKRAGYDLVPLDFGRAYKCRREQKGGGDLVAWRDKLRSTSG
ncbi:hypothetical protein ACOI1H_00580 [Loktanella sp. DJP18]|uniref:hypothetical protein n=1 Tax=Loktanella sp. DJP18 TaxID=3409788 RepID=UPI003BB5F503